MCRGLVCLDETAFRFNNRDNPYLFRDTLLKLLAADSVPYMELVENGHNRAAD